MSISFERIRQAHASLNRFDPYPVTGFDVSTADAVTGVRQGMDAEFTTVPHATDDDIAEAAVLLDTHRSATINRLDHDELIILDGLTAIGWTYQQIGEHLGYPKRTAAAQAAARIKRLHAKFPSFQRPQRPTPP